MANNERALLEAPDIESSSDDYATRFAGAVGAWFLQVQAQATLSLLARLQAPGATLLDVGGGHGQTVGPLSEQGYQVTVLGSSAQCRGRIRPYLEQGRAHYAIGRLTALPYADASFDITMSYRILPHLTDWQQLVGELARVSRRAVIVDFPSVRSVNLIADSLFGLKQRVEGNTRPFRLFREAEVVAEFARHGYRPVAKYPQFLLPMALHRAVNRRALSVLVERAARGMGLTRWFGSPIIYLFQRVD